MRFVIVFFFLICIQSVYSASLASKEDMLSLLAKGIKAEEKCVIYRNLVDLEYDAPDEKLYLKLLIEEAEKVDNKELLAEAWAELGMMYVQNQQFDSVDYCISQIARLGDNEGVKCWHSFLYMYNFNMEVAEGDGTDAINKYSEELEKNKKREDIYFRIENAYILANGLYTQGKLKQAMPYAQTAQSLAASLPFKEGARIHLYTIRLLSRILMRDRQSAESISWMEKYIGLQEKYYEQYYKPTRPYYNINSRRISAYTTLMIGVCANDPSKAAHYLQKIVEFCKEAKSPYDRYCCFLATNNYHLVSHNYLEALISNDSLIKYAKVVAPYNLPTLYRGNSNIYKNLGDYKSALEQFKLFYSMSDSLKTLSSNEHLNQLQVQYDVNKLNYEKSQLEVRSKHILLICLFFILLLSIAVCCYLYKDLKKERAMKMELSRLNAKVSESENMKTAFIRSVCHEIRTPLNAIVGFSDLMCSIPDLDEEMRISFPEEIHKNSLLLTSLISRMLEVSELDVSNEKLPVELTDIRVVFVQEMEKLEGKCKKEIAYVLDIPDESFQILTNMHYLSLILENLLDNANKFTEKGKIILHYECNRTNGRILISVTDTGCGIPVEMHAKVFERFHKLDAYKPGNGLGLYICWLITKRLGGDIRIDPGYLEGTRMLLELPM